MAGGSVSYTYGTGGIKVVAPEKYVHEALQILEQDFKSIESENERDKEKPVCSVCNSTKITEKPATNIFLKLLFALFVVIVVPNTKNVKHKYMCRTCKHTWKSY